MRYSMEKPPTVDTIRLRAAVEDDLEVVGAIEHASFSDPWSSGDFREVMASPRSIFLVAEKEGMPVDGYAIAMFVGDEAEILNIAVVPGMRGTGIGRVLLYAMIEMLRERQVASVFLEVRESNVAARALYERVGFEEISKRKKYYRAPVEDALILRLEIKR